MGPTIHYLERSEVWAQLSCGDLIKIVWRIITQIIMMALGLFVVPVGLLSCRRNSSRMSSLFWFWDNAVDTINGDPGWWAICDRTWWLGHHTSYWSRFYWLVVRNSARNYSMWVGVRPCDVEEIWINKQYDQNPYRRQCNSLIVKARTWDETYYVMWLPSWRVTANLRIVGKFGFKFWDLIPLASEGSKEKCQFVFYPSIQKGMKCREG